MAAQVQRVSNQSSPDAKVALFGSLFRGRDDVYARRFHSRKTGKSGYSPTCANQWATGLCDKPRVKCADCPHRHFLPVTAEVVRWHLSGRDDQGRDFVMGLYPMLLDETCCFLAADFDKACWQDDADAVLDTCLRMDIPAALERSRSGNGGHVWFFFDVPIPATLARRLGAHILTETMERRPDIGFDSYDRFFPNQDTLPQRGFGNLIALPLQQQPRQLGHSLFIDPRHNPHPDQWAFLAQVHKISRHQAEGIVATAQRRGRIVGVRIALPDEEQEPSWAALPDQQVSRGRRPAAGPIAGSLPEALELTLSNQIYIAREPLPPGLRNRLLRLAAFQNPEFFKAQAMRLPTYAKPRVIGCAEDQPHYIGIPRGCLPEVQALLTDLRIPTTVRDQRSTGSPLEVTFHGQLRPDQAVAARAMLAHDLGVLSAATAFGKTVVGTWLIAQRGVSTLILVHRRQLLEQWVEHLSALLDLPPKAIGRIGGGCKSPTGRLDVAIIQSLVRKGIVNDCVEGYGHVIIDECHHVPAFNFERVVRRARAQFVTGLSATVARKDGHHPIIFMQCGPIRHRVDAKVEAATRPFQHTVLVRPTAFRPRQTAAPDRRVEFHDLCAQLVEDDVRNELICGHVIDAVRHGRSPLVLTERKRHLDRLAERLAPQVCHLVVLHGGVPPHQARQIADRLATIPTTEQRVLVATGRYIGEGFDDARLDTLFLTMPVSWRGTIAQYVGRLHRRCDGKREVRVHDYADLNVPMLARMFDRRCRGYEAVGYTILLPGSAVPGWPADVPLPIDAQWKGDHAASVRRLARDGVDAPLAQLFAAAAVPPSPTSIGTDQARSATEAFLYQRLNTLPATTGLFRLNQQLPIPFDAWGHMEVDLLCAEARVAIELDGPQHLDDVDAYRRDRRKDLLLQQHGYFVLRFLTEDVRQHLDKVLDTILRTLTHQRERGSY